MKTSLLVMVIILFWGLWGFLNKIAVGKIGSQINLWNAITILLITALYLLFSHDLFPLRKDPAGILLAVVAGVFTTLGTIAFFALLSQKPAGVIITVTALYPIITIILSFIFLHESFTLNKIIGISLALVALIFLNM